MRISDWSSDVCSSDLDGGRGPKELTGMVDLTRDATGRVRARLLDLVPGRSSKAYADWIKERDEQFRAGVKIAALDPFAGYKKALDDELDDATDEIGRASCRARVCLYVEISGVAGGIKKKKK